MPRPNTTARFPRRLLTGRQRYANDPFHIRWDRTASAYLKDAQHGCCAFERDCPKCHRADTCSPIEGDVAQGDYSRGVTTLFSRGVLVPAQPGQKGGFVWVCAPCSNAAGNDEDVQLLDAKPIDYIGPDHCQFADHMTSPGHRKNQKQFFGMLLCQTEADNRAPDLVLSFMSRVQRRRKEKVAEANKKRGTQGSEEKSKKKPKTEKVNLVPRSAESK